MQTRNHHSTEAAERNSAPTTAVYPRPTWPDFQRFLYSPAGDVFFDLATHKRLTRTAFNALWGRRHPGVSLRRSAAVVWLERAPADRFVYKEACQ